MHRYIIFLFFAIIGAANLFAQNKLSEKRLSVHWVNVALKNAFQELSQETNLEFSYSSDIPSDKKIDYQCKNKTVVEIVKDIVGHDCSVEIHDNYLIIKIPLRKSVEINLVILDRLTEKPIPYVSILSSGRWKSTMTDEDGVANISLAAGDNQEQLQIRHINYIDTSIVLTNEDIQKKIYLTQKVDTLENILLIGKLQKSFWSFLLPKYLKRQSLNLHDIFKKGPAQFSLLPGFGTRGRLQSQAINNFSVNVLGGYSMRTDGLEVGGLFNLSQGSSHALQVGGLTNMVGGSFTGIQVAGLHNNVIDTVRGLQLSGMSNKTQSVLKGVQISPFYNEARINKGLQIGLVNSSDSSYGYSIGLLNFVKSGHFGLHAFNSDFFSVGLGFRTGTKRTFTEIQLAHRNRTDDRLLMAGIVLGTDIPFSKRVGLELSVGVYQGLGGWTSNVGYLRSKNSESSMFQYNALLYFPIMKNISFLGGVTRYTNFNDNYSNRRRDWWGWQGGAVWYFNQAGKQNKPLIDKKDWSLSVAISQGTNLDFDSPVYGSDVQIRRKLDTRVYLQLTQGYSYYGGSDVGYYPYNNYDYNFPESNKFKRKGIFSSLVGLSFYPKNQNRFYIGSSVGFFYLHKPSFSYSPYIGWDLSSRFAIEAQFQKTIAGEWAYSTATATIRYNIFR